MSPSNSELQCLRSPLSSFAGTSDSATLRESREALVEVKTKSELAFIRLNDQADDFCVNILSPQSRREAAESDAPDQPHKANGRIKFVFALVAVGLLVCAAALRLGRSATKGVRGSSAIQQFNAKATKDDQTSEVDKLRQEVELLRQELAEVNTSTSITTSATRTTSTSITTSVTTHTSTTTSATTTTSTSSTTSVTTHTSTTTSGTTTTSTSTTTLVCFCANGIAAKGAACTANDAHICGSCLTAYRPSGNLCVAKADPYVVAAIYSGRGERMRILLPYLNRLRGDGKVDEIHLWDFTLYDKDRAWIATAAQQNGYTLMNYNGPKGFCQVYDHYAGFQRPTSTGDGPVVILKVDDDIVYVDTETFGDFTRFTAKHPEMLLVHANVVNNGVAAYYQFKQPALSSSPLAGPLDAYPPKGIEGPLLTRNSPLVSQLHDMFLGNPRAFRWGDANSCIEFHAPDMPSQGRISINFYAARQESWATLAQLVRDANGDDEHAVTTMATAANFRECIFTSFNAVHLSFGLQFEAAMFATRYKQLLEIQGLQALPGLDDPCAEGEHSVVRELLRVDHPFDDLRESVKGIDGATCKAMCYGDAACKGIAFVFEENAVSECFLKADITATAFSDPYHCLWTKPT